MGDDEGGVAGDASGVGGALALLEDPGLVQGAAELAFHQVGAGGKLRLRVGGKTGRFSGAPVDLDAEVVELATDAMMEVAEGYVRDHMPEKERMTARFLPFYRALHMRAATTDVPASHAPVRLACRCMSAPLRHTFSCS